MTMHVIIIYALMLWVEGSKPLPFQLINGKLNIKENQMTKEEWKDIYGYEGIYRVSILGKVINIKRNKHRKTELTNVGYERIGLHKNGNKEKILLHRLIAIHFIPNPENKPCVNHKDENKTNNNVFNLEWVTHKENINHGTNIQRHSKPVLQICDGVVIKEWPSAIDAGRAGYSEDMISNCCRGVNKTHKGFTWKHKIIKRVEV